jgi:hypothetical protein
MNIDPKIFEAIMLLCFGSSWPFAVAKTIRIQSVKGKSILFLLLIFAGYISGVVYKLAANFDHVIWIYCFNGILVFAEIVLYIRYRRMPECPVSHGRIPGIFWPSAEESGRATASGGS